MVYQEIRLPNQVDLSPGCKVMIYEGAHHTGTLQALMDWGFSFESTSGLTDEALNGFKFEVTDTELNTDLRQGDLLVRQITNGVVSLHIFHEDGTSEHIRLSLTERESHT